MQNLSPQLDNSITVNKPRRRYFIQPGFQTRFIARFCLIVLFSTALTSLATIGVLALNERNLQGTLFYVTKVKGSSIVAMKKTDIILPVVAFSGVANLLIATILGLIFSHRHAGPAYRLQKELDSIAAGNGAKPIRLRPHDEFHELAESFNKALEKIRPAGTTGKAGNS